MIDIPESAVIQYIHTGESKFREVIMTLNLGTKIRDLRKRDSRTQEDLASALGVSAQAVSRWENDNTFPDMTLIPAIANYFGVSIDELFGYENDRDRRIDAILEKNERLGLEDNGVDVHLDERLRMLREGLAEFPANERLFYALAETLTDAGWIRLGEGSVESGDYLVHNVEEHKKNPYWNEAMPMFERLIASTSDTEIREKSIYWLILLYSNIGEYEKGLALAEKMPTMYHSREFLRVRAVEGELCEKYYGMMLIGLARAFSTSVIQALMVKQSNFRDDLPVRKLRMVIDLFDALFEGGNYGTVHGDMISLYLYLSEHQWRIGEKDEAFASLDKALEHARSLDRLTGSKGNYTAPLLEKAEWDFTAIPNEDSASLLPGDWPFYMRPAPRDIRAEITADPRWKIWADKCMKK